MMPTRIAGWASALAADKGERLSMRTAAKAERTDFMEARILQLDGPRGKSTPTTPTPDRS
jgi:hypothetical protein